MKTPMLKSIVCLSLLATLFLSGCSSDPVVSQTTTTRRTAVAPVSGTVVETPVVESTTTTTRY